MQVALNFLPLIRINAPEIFADERFGEWLNTVTTDGRKNVPGHRTATWHRPGEEPGEDSDIFMLLAGPDGMEGLVLNFPVPGGGVPEELAAAAADGNAGFKTWQCVLCAFVYDEASGLPEEGIAPGTRWADVPETFGCPDCSAQKADFEMVEL